MYLQCSPEGPSVNRHIGSHWITEKNDKTENNQFLHKWRKYHFLYVHIWRKYCSFNLLTRHWLMTFCSSRTKFFKAFHDEPQPKANFSHIKQPLKNTVINQELVETEGNFSCCSVLNTKFSDSTSCLPNHPQEETSYTFHN